MMTIKNVFAGLLGDNANLLELSNMLDGVGDSDDFISKRRMDVGDDEDDDDVIEAKAPKPKSLSMMKKPPKPALTNEVGDLSGLANLGDLSSLLEMLTSESKNKESQARPS